MLFSMEIEGFEHFGEHDIAQFWASYSQTTTHRKVPSNVFSSSINKTYTQILF